jgi:hypothetical protein
MENSMEFHEFTEFYGIRFRQGCSKWNQLYSLLCNKIISISIWTRVLNFVNAVKLKKIHAEILLQLPFSTSTCYHFQQNWMK